MYNRVDVVVWTCAGIILLDASSSPRNNVFYLVRLAAKYLFSVEKCLMNSDVDFGVKGTTVVVLQGYDL